MAETTSRESRLLGAAAYFLVALSGLFLLLVRREDRYVRFHALQAVLGTAVFSLFGAILWILGNLPLFGFLYTYLLRTYLFVLFLYWIFVMAQAWQGHRHLIPVLGRLVEREFD